MSAALSAANFAGVAFAERGFVKTAFVETACAETAFVETTFAETAFVETACAEATFVETACTETAFVETAFAETAFVETAFAETAFVKTAFAETAFVEAAFAEAAFVEAAFAEAALAGAGTSFNGEVFRLGFLVWTATGFRLALGIFASALGAFFAGTCFLDAGFAATTLSFAGFCLGGETETFVFFFKLWPEEAVFFFPPAFEGLAFLGETFRVLFFFEEADLAAGLSFLLATLSPSSMKADIYGVIMLFFPRNGSKAGCQSKKHPPRPPFLPGGWGRLLRKEI